MDYRQTLINMVDRFNVTAVEEFKEIELKIIADSKSIFKKNKDFDGHIEKLRKCKRAAQRIDPRSVGVSPADREMAELKEHLQRCIVIFNGLCDDYIQFQTALRAKSSGEEKIKYSEIRHINEKIRCAKANLKRNGYDPDKVLKARVKSGMAWIPWFALITQIFCLLMLAFATPVEKAYVAKMEALYGESDLAVGDTGGGIVIFCIAASAIVIPMIVYLIQNKRGKVTHISTLHGDEKTFEEAFPPINGAGENN